ncbi:MAG TPA: LysR family transcriptional regulator [Phenylobacterium sp.]
MDIRRLQQVLAIRKHGSFSKAADALGVSQPNLSKSVARLEDELKVKIFDRTAKGSALTPIGELIVERADAVIAETRDLARDAALLAGGETGIVRIGCTTSLTMPLVTPLVQAAVKKHPGLRVHAEVAASARLLPLLEARELDLVFTGQPPADPTGSAYVVECILETSAVFVASPAHPLAEERSISIERLAEFRCGGSQSPGSSNARLLGFESDNLGMYTASHYEILLPLVLSGDAVLLAPAFVVQAYLEGGQMVVLDVEWRLETKFHFATTRAASFSPIVVELRDHARAFGAKLGEEWRGVADQFMRR